MFAIGADCRQETPQLTLRAVLSITAPTALQPYRPAHPPKRVLLICLRRLGDVLLTTPLIRSLRRAWPEAQIEVLVQDGAAAVLEGNPDIDRVIVEPARGMGARLGLALRLLRRYDLAISTLYNDRPHLYALLAGRRRVNIVPPAGEPGAARKRRLSQGWCELRLGRLHAVDQYLELADVMGIERVPEVVPPRPPRLDRLDALLGADWQARPQAVLHPSPMYRYKAWPEAGWRSAIQHLVQRHGLHVVLSGGPGEAERQQIESILRGLPPDVTAQVTSAAGRLSLAELAELLRRARLYLGPDTSVTHLAAACGTPTLALFGPSHPIAWGPWPRATDTARGHSPWQMKASLQRAGNVWLIQGEGDCVPCLQEGCERHLDSHARCLDELDAVRVGQVLDQALDASPRLPPS